MIANLFYRGLMLRRAPLIGDTLRTSTEVVALRDTSARAGRAPTGLAVLRIHTVDQLDREVLDYHRCAMLPMRSEDARPGHAGDLDAISGELAAAELRASIAGWDLATYRELVPGAHGDSLTAGTSYAIDGGDSVTCAPELARLSLNIAAAHTDPGATGHGRRLVYGGHTIGIALAHATRALPNLVTVLGWRSCDHLAPVFEGDVLRSVVTVEAIDPPLVDLRVETLAERAGDGARDAVLDWRLVGAMA